MTLEPCPRPECYETGHHWHVDGDPNRGWDPIYRLEPATQIPVDHSCRGQVTTDGAVMSPCYGASVTALGMFDPYYVQRPHELAALRRRYESAAS